MPPAAAEVLGSFPRTAWNRSEDTSDEEGRGLRRGAIASGKEVRNERAMTMIGALLLTPLII